MMKRLGSLWELICHIFSREKPLSERVKAEDYVKENLDGAMDEINTVTFEAMRRWDEERKRNAYADNAYNRALAAAQNSYGYPNQAYQNLANVAANPIYYIDTTRPKSSIFTVATAGDGALIGGGGKASASYGLGNVTPASTPAAEEEPEPKYSPWSNEVRKIDL
jgi:hypothetical protein